MLGVYRNHKAFQKVTVRKFLDDMVYPDAQELELDGKQPSQEASELKFRQDDEGSAFPDRHFSYVPTLPLRFSPSWQ